ncbi:hypothetical protein AX16_007846 [Volvariella volvacea WC 439]|nr:hypothetical protein AX16_007846 [Volvariella volvacea WC 439]
MALASSTVPNVVLFGASGCGKSSIVNMLTDTDNFAPTSPDATRCTTDSLHYRVSIFGQPFNIYDTPGLEEGGKDSAETVLKLCDLLKSISGGVHLLAFCMRVPRMSQYARRNWILLNKIVCENKVPILIVTTALELQSHQSGGMESWWFNNKKYFEQLGMVPRGHACITSTRGKEVQPGIFAYGQEYDESREKLMKLIRSSALVSGWKVQKDVRILKPPSGLYKFFVDSGMTKEEAQSLHDALKPGAGFWVIAFWFALALLAMAVMGDS